MQCDYRRNLDEMGARLQHTPQKSLRCLAQETSTLKSAAVAAVKLVKVNHARQL
jgi:hypothetical protein